MNHQFDEIQVFEGVAERTGVVVDRDALRGSKTVCRTLSELTRKARRMGDGHFYLATTMWPASESKIDLSVSWTTMA